MNNNSSKEHSRPISIYKLGILKIADLINELGFNKSAEFIKRLHNAPDKQFEPEGNRLRKDSVITYYQYLLHGKCFNVNHKLCYDYQSGNLEARWIFSKENISVHAEFVTFQKIYWRLVMGKGKKEIRLTGYTGFKEFHDLLAFYKIRRK